MHLKHQRAGWAGAWVVVMVGVSACTEDGTGTGGNTAGTGRAQVFAVPEETVQSGLVAGTGDEEVVDGWNVSYSKFLVVLGNFRAARSSNPSDVRRLPTMVAVDLTQTPESGVVLGELSDLEAARWDKVGYDIGHADSSTQRDSSMSQADFDRMVQNGWSLYVEATLSRNVGGVVLMHHIPGWGVRAATSFDDCASDSGDTGFSVTSGGTVQVQPTIHGDHWFFNNITQGAEVTERRAQWVVDSDVNQDGQTTLEELQATAAADVFPASQYNLTGGLGAVNTAHDYFVVQARTLGDFNGEGECPTRAVLP
jgi:hypothetical protein